MANKPKTLQPDRNGIAAVEAKAKLEGRLSALDAAITYADGCGKGYTLNISFRDGSDCEYCVIANGPGWALVRRWNAAGTVDDVDIFIDAASVDAVGVLW